MRFLHSLQNIIKFGGGCKKQNQKGDVVYCQGSFDPLLPRHVEFFRKAKKSGSKLVVGIYSDKMIKRVKGEPFPLLNEYQRFMNLLSMKHVDDVIFRAPYQVDKQIIRKLKIKKVVAFEDEDWKVPSSKIYQLPMEMGIL